MRPPYIDPTTGVAYDTDKGDYEGYLTKQSMWLRVSALCFRWNLFYLNVYDELADHYQFGHLTLCKSQDWRRRFFILKGSRLFFAKTPYEAPHGMIDLSRCTTVKSADLKAHKKHSFEISTPETTYLLYAGELACW